MASELSPEEILKQSKLPDAPPTCTWALDKSKCGPCPHRISPQRFGLVFNRFINGHSVHYVCALYFCICKEMIHLFCQKIFLSAANIITIHSTIDVRVDCIGMSLSVKVHQYLSHVQHS